MLYAEETFYLNGPFHGQILTIWDAADVSVTYGDQTILPDEFGTITLTFPETSARYLKVVAGCLEALPEWHGGKGRPGFVFVDEIVVK